jgi:AcrR family transcriptional regulator
MATLAGDRRDAVLGAVVRCFAAHGYQATSMQLLAKAAGMSRPALYQYFSNKLDVFIAAATWDFDRQARAVESIAAEDADAMSRAARMLDIVVALYAPASEGNSFQFDLVDEVLRRAGPAWADFQERIVLALVGVIHEVADGVDHSQARIAAAALITCAKGVGIDSGNSSSPLLSIAELVELVLEGLSSPR